MTLFKHFSLLFLFISHYVHGYDVFGPQPRITATNGHLIFTAAEHKNITFKTQGTGRVQINGVDLSQTAQMVKESSDTILNKYLRRYGGTLTKIQSFGDMLHGKSSIIERLRDLEAAAKNATNSPPEAIQSNSMRRLSRQMRKAQTTLIQLNHLLSKNECQNNPCLNGGTCQDLFNDFFCHCPDAWEGHTCDKDVNECARFAGTDLGCQNGATCNNKPGTYECLCMHGWFGIHCTRRSASCENAPSSEMCGHGTCISQNNEVGYTCICDQGWTKGQTGQACTKDVDECTLNKPPCSVNPKVPCENTPGSFFCGSCPAGYVGSGFYCTDVDECQTLNGGCSMNPMVQCTNTLGSRMCGPCPLGYIGDGLVCSYAGGVCKVNNGGCHQLAICTDYPRQGPNVFQCACPPGYIGNGLGPNGCMISAITPCLPDPCKHGQCTLSNATGGYTCHCDSNMYYGKNCDQTTDFCISNPCKNGGVCRSLRYSFRCDCMSTYTGPTCNIERQACGRKLRNVNGTLKYPPTDYADITSGVNCAWTIETDADKILRITFKKFQLDSSCLHDWLEIHDGRNTAAHNFGRFCGTEFPNKGTITSTHNIVFIWFRSDRRSTVEAGFEIEWKSEKPDCNSDLSIESHGTIMSPGSPGNYPNNRDCMWSLSGPLGKRLVFHFYALMIGDSPDCSADFLEFFPSMDSNEKPFAKYCNSSTPAPIYSPGSDVMVHFHSNGKDTYPGFQISYAVTEGIPGCGGLFTQDSGEIRSPSSHGRYLSNMRCEYKIKLAQQLRIKITFLMVDLEESTRCDYDYIAIHNGPSIGSPLVGRYCSNHLPASYTSSSNEVLLEFKSDWSESGKGFLIQYETVCGGKFTASSGIIESEGYPSSYLSDVACIYEIIQPVGTLIELSFLDFDLEENTDGLECVYDYLEVRDGDNENSTIIGKYCLEAPSKLVSSQNYLWLQLKTDDTVTGKGFKAKYTTIKTGCGGILKEKVGTITTPEHLGKYKAQSNCNWLISAPTGNVIQIVWIQFQIEGSFSCNYDSVTVYDNNTVSSRGGLIGKYCGNKLPPTLLSSSNLVTVSFSSDKTVNLNGFIASYSFIPQSKICDGNYFTNGGVIRSPGYPDRYPSNSDCVWTIRVLPGRQIMLNVTKFNINTYHDCRFSFLEIRNGGSASSPLINRYCGEKIPKLISSHANQLYLHFKADIMKSGNGFEIIWESETTGCGGILSSPTGSIISPEYPEPYNRMTDCFWKISVSQGSLIQAVFSDLDLEGNNDCGLDYVEIFDGNSVAANSLGRFCTADHPPYIRSTNNQLYIHFRSDVSLQGRGFQLQYSTVCSNNLTGFSGVIESQNFPSGYPIAQNCVWNIIVPAKNKINITFSHFDLQRVYRMVNSSCSVDFLEIKYLEETSEGGEKYTTYGKYCDKDVPQLISINSDHAQVHLSTTSLVIGTGFRLEWILDGCGGHLYKEGIIRSPNYPKSYPADIECLWIIETDFGKSIEIRFHDVDLEIDSNCTYDAIKLFNGPAISYPMISHLCHQDQPVVLTSVGKFLTVHFTSDFSYHGKGFQANFSSVLSKCGGEMTSIRGSIFSPNYPKNYDRNDSCEWIITTDETHVIDLVFEDVQLPSYAQACNNVYIKIHDGPTAAYPLLAKICGNSLPNRTITSTINHMYVEFRTSLSITGKGFKANYMKACGARIVATRSGNIQMQRDTFPDSESTNCSWIIVSPEPSKHVFLTITRMDNQMMSCEDNYPVKVYDGETTNDALIGKYCDSKLPPTISSSGSALHINVETTISFFATYSVYGSQCGGTLNSFNAYFATPGYPKQYPFNNECEWTIEVAPGNQVSVTFTYFELLESDNCNTDYLEIRKLNSSGKLLGVFCGKNTPTNISHDGSLWMYFKSSSAKDRDVSLISAKGFIGEYAMELANDLKAPSGQIGSPLYPHSFRSYGDYSWRVTVTFGKKIKITFKEFNLELYSDDYCYISSVKVFDGTDSDSEELGAFCGNKIPDPVKTSSNIAYITASFNSARTGSIFLLEWDEIDNYKTGLDESNKTISGCGAKDVVNVNTLHNYTLISPGYPYGYSNMLNCEWMFSTIPMNHLKIRFSDLNLEASYIGYQGCYLDHVELFSGVDGTKNWESIRKICLPNETYSIVHSTTNLLKVNFVTNYYGNATGFKAQISEGCGGSLSGPSGYIIFDKDNPRETQCQWNVTVRIGRTIKISFMKFNIPHFPQLGCNNFLMLKNGHFANSPILGNGKYCGNAKPPQLQTTSNYLYVKYQGTQNIDGFKLRYEEVSYACGGTLELDSFGNTTEITSPNYPNIPTPHIECFWIIRSPAGTSIQLNFLERFDLTETKECDTEYVEIRDGASTFSRPIGKFCNTIPGTQFSTDNMMFVKFFTDVDNPRNGFKASLSIATCGGTVRGISGEIQWSSSANGKYANTNCTWHIIAPSDHILSLKYNFIKLSFNTPSCILPEKIRIYEVNKLNATETLVNETCGNKMPDIIPLNSNEAIVRFSTTNIKPLTTNAFSIGFNSTYENCTYYMNGDAGVIQSPGYPHMNYEKRYCTWYITVPHGRRVTLQLRDFDMDDGAMLRDQGLGIYENKDFKNVVKYMRAGDTQRKFQSSGNIMFVYFWTKYHSRHRGFSAYYSSNEPTICLGGFESDSGIITQPANSSKYCCIWKHTRGPEYVNKTLALTIESTLDLVPYIPSVCRSGFAGITVYSDADGRGIFADVCKNITTPIVVRTPKPILFMKAWLSFKTFNFVVTYATFNCGGIINAEKGYILSPNFPNAYSDSIECSWLLILPVGQQVNISFAFVDLGNDCEKNFIDIYNGESRMAPKLERLCKGTKLGVLQSQTNVISIEYHSVKDFNGKGFNITYEPIIKGCGGVFHDAKRIIQTPNYPADYASNTECFWDIRAPNGYHIGFKFIGRFHIEESDNCDKDYIQILDWKDEKWTEIKKLCGREVPNIINSTSTRMRVLFRSNDKISASGFKANWEFNCGGTFEATENKQYIISPGYPETYFNSLNCVYKISSYNKFINIAFLDFNLERGLPSCPSDNLTISTDQYGYGRINGLDIFCGDKKPQDVRYRSEIVVTLKTDRWVTARGFKFSYNVDDCGGIISSPRTISSPKSNFTKPSSYYYGMIDCVWNVTAPNKKIVVVRFETFKTTNRISCYYDNLIIYSGNEVNIDNKLVTLCGDLSQYPPTISSPNNSMLIVMKLDPTATNTGFVADIYFTAGPADGCGGQFNITETKVISAPNNVADVDCHWTFMAKSDYLLQFEFESIRLPSNCNENKKHGPKNCTCTFIEIRDGGGPFSTLIEQYCSDASPNQQKLTTSTKYGYLRFYMSGPGDNTFRLKVTPVLSKCGTSSLNVTSSKQILTSPFYPNQIPDDLRCEWILRSNQNYQKFVMRFLDFDLSEEKPPSEDSCSYDRLEIEDGDLHSLYNQGLGKNTIFSGIGKTTNMYVGDFIGTQMFCGRNDKPFDYYTQSSEVNIMLKSKHGSNRGRGFKIEYYITGCNRNYTEDNGRISAQLNKKDCIITITVAENKTISLYPDQFFMYYTKDCNMSSMEVRDGGTNSSNLLLQACGYAAPSPVFSTGNKLWIRSQSTESEQRTSYGNYEMFYTSSDKGRGCGGSMYDTSGKFTSPMYPNEYRNDSICTWEIRVPIGSKLVLSFTEFDIQADCVSNYLKVTTYENSKKDDHTFCKNDEPAALYSTGRATVVYQSSTRNGGRGWVGRFKIGDDSTPFSQPWRPVGARPRPGIRFG